MFRENEHRVGLVLTDLVMPEMSGVVLAEEKPFSAAKRLEVVREVLNRREAGSAVAPR